MVVGLESHAAWVKHRDAYVDDLHPEGPVETRLAELIASLHWRIGRAEAFLRDISSWGIQVQVGDLLEDKDVPRSESHQDMDIPSRLVWLLEGPHADNPIVKEILSRVQRYALPEGKMLDLIIRYSGSLERALNQADRKLEKLQDRRWAQEDRAERRAGRGHAQPRAERRRAEPSRPIEIAMDDPTETEKGSAIEPEMGRLEPEKPIAAAITPPPAVDLGSFGCEPVKAEPIVTSVPLAPVAKAVTLPPPASQLIFRDTKGRVKRPDQYSQMERKLVQSTARRRKRLLKAARQAAAEAKIDPTSASGPIEPPPPTA